MFPTSIFAIPRMFRVQGSQMTTPVTTREGDSNSKYEQTTGSLLLPVRRHSISQTQGQAGTAHGDLDREEALGHPQGSQGTASVVEKIRHEGGLGGSWHTGQGIDYRYRKWGGTCTVKVFAMEVSKVVRDWEESFRDREWFSHREALRRIKGKDLQEIVRRLPNLV